MPVMPMRTQDIQNETNLNRLEVRQIARFPMLGNKLFKDWQGSSRFAVNGNRRQHTNDANETYMGLKITSVNGLPINQISHWHSHRDTLKPPSGAKMGKA